MYMIVNLAIVLQYQHKEIMCEQGLIAKKYIGMDTYFNFGFILCNKSCFMTKLLL